MRLSQAIDTFRQSVILCQTQCDIKCNEMNLMFILYLGILFLPVMPSSVIYFSVYTT